MSTLHQRLDYSRLSADLAKKYMVCLASIDVASFSGERRGAEYASGMML
jgi:hypothetical protein